MVQDRALPGESAVRAGDPILIGVDVGTSSVRAVAFGASGRRIASDSRPTPARPAETGGEYDPDDIFAAVVDCLSAVGTALAGRSVAGIAVSSVGESCVLIDRSGRALAPSIVWHDRRTEGQARAIENAIGRERIFQISGHAVEPIFTLAKLMWMREHWPDAMASARRVLMMADWIAFRLSGEAATDPTLASRTLYFDIRQRRWSEEMLALAGVDERFPAPLTPSGSVLGPVRAAVLSTTGIAGTPVVAVGGHDHIVGGLAMGLNEPGTVIDSVGTAEALLVATAVPLADPETVRRGYVQGAIATDRKLSYIAGALLSSGGAIEWLRATFGQNPRAKLIEEASSVPPGSHGVVFVPHLANGPPPVPDVRARGAFLGLTQTVTPAILYRAVLEGVAMQSRMMLDGMASLPGIGPFGDLRLIGGTSRNRLFLSIKASVFGRPILVVEEPEATALGAALLAGVAAGIFPSLEVALSELARDEYLFEPDETAERYEELRTRTFERVLEAMPPINRAVSAP